MDLLRLERQRQELEQNLQKLRASLKHWQTLTFELEGFKEEIEASSLDTPLDFVSLSKSYDGQIVNEQEIRDLAGLDSASPRTSSQVLGMISRRQEYVDKNIETVQRQFWDAEAKLEEFDFAAYQAGAQSGAQSTGPAGLPLTEIHEELDEEGNITSSTLSHPEDSTARLVETLRKAGVSEEDLKGLSAQGEDDPDGYPGTSGSQAIPPPALVKKKYFSTNDIPKVNSNIDEGDTSPDRPSMRKKSVSFSADTKAVSEPARSESEDGKKTVSFNDKIAVMPAAPPPDRRSVSFSPTVEEIPAEPSLPQPDKTVSFSPQVEEISVEPSASSTTPDVNPASSTQKDLRSMFRIGAKVHEMNDGDGITATHVVIPKNETEEDARMRREMLDYHLKEVGHVVAEMNLVEGDEYEEYDDDEIEEEETASASDFASSEHPDEDTPYTSGLSESDDESEDEHGRTKTRVISDDYHKHMKALEQRLIGNLGPAPSERDVNDIDPNINPSDVRRLVVHDKKNSIGDADPEFESKVAPKKRVSFAEALDVADEEQASKGPQFENRAPIVDSVSERAGSGKVATAPSPLAPAKTSRFKQARSTPVTQAGEEDDDDDHSGPPGKIIAETLFERTNVKRKVAPPSADDPDPIMQRRELAAEYYRRRNDLIRQQGGFTKAAADDEDQEEGELMEERPDGRLRKVSRFRSARIKPQ